MMIAVTVAWIVLSIGALVFIGLPLILDSDQKSDHCDGFCQLCGGSLEYGSVCHDCVREMGE